MLIVSVLLHFVCLSPIQLVFLSHLFHYRIRITFATFMLLNLVTAAKSAFNPIGERFIPFLKTCSVVNITNFN